MSLCTARTCSAILSGAKEREYARRESPQQTEHYRDHQGSSRWPCTTHPCSKLDDSHGLLDIAVARSWTSLLKLNDGVLDLASQILGLETGLSGRYKSRRRNECHGDLTRLSVLQADGL